MIHQQFQHQGVAMLSNCCWRTWSIHALWCLQFVLQLKAGAHLNFLINVFCLSPSSVGHLMIFLSCQLVFTIPYPRLYFPPLYEKTYPFQGCQECFILSWNFKKPFVLFLFISCGNPFIIMFHICTLRLFGGLIFLLEHFWLQFLLELVLMDSLPSFLMVGESWFPEKIPLCYI